MVNVLDVPVQSDMPAPDLERLSASAETPVFTLDPKDKYLPPGVRRASTTSAIQSRKRLQILPGKKAEAVAKGPEEIGAPPRTSASLHESLSLEEQRSLVSIFNKLRKTRSAGSDLKAGSSWPRKIFSRTGHSRKRPPSEEIPEVPVLPPNHVEIAKLPSAQTLEPPVQADLRTSNYHSQRGANLFAFPEERQSPSRKLSDEDRNVESPHADTVKINSTTLNQSESQNFADVGCLKPAKKLPQSNLRLDQASILTPFRTHTIHEPRVEVCSAMDKGILAGDHVGPSSANVEDTTLSPEVDAESSTYSYAASEGFSPCLASNTTYSGPMSPYHLSQPETPIMSDFDENGVIFKRDSLPLSDDFYIEQPSRPPPPPPEVRTTAAFPSNKGFQGYSLPAFEYESSTTIRKLPSTIPDPTETGLDHRSSKQSLVHSWDDGSEHRMSSLKEFVDDLGYLGDLII